MRRIGRALKAAWLWVFGDARKEMKAAPAAGAPEEPDGKPSAP